VPEEGLRGLGERCTEATTEMGSHLVWNERAA
jgi:hypothetical protein